MRPRQHDRFVLIGLCWLYGRSEYLPHSLEEGASLDAHVMEMFEDDQVSKLLTVSLVEMIAQGWPLSTALMMGPEKTCVPAGSSKPTSSRIMTRLVRHGRSQDARINTQYNASGSTWQIRNRHWIFFIN